MVLNLVGGVTLQSGTGRGLLCLKPHVVLLLPPTKEEVNAFASICLSVSKITQKRVHEFGRNVAS